MKQTRVEIEALGDRMDHIENRMGDYVWAHSEVADAHDDSVEDIRNIKIKMAALEDHSHQDNVRFQGIAESAPATDLAYLYKKL